MFFLTNQKFQSTRLLQASTEQFCNGTGYPMISIHEALASLDHLEDNLVKLQKISIHEALASLDHLEDNLVKLQKISIHEALTSLDSAITVRDAATHIFQSTRLLQASTIYNVSIATTLQYFNPRGSYKPRRSMASSI